MLKKHYAMIRLIRKIRMKNKENISSTTNTPQVTTSRANTSATTDLAIKKQCVHPSILVVKQIHQYLEEEPHRKVNVFDNQIQSRTDKAK